MCVASGSEYKNTSNTSACLAYRSGCSIALVWLSLWLPSRTAPLATDESKTSIAVGAETDILTALAVFNHTNRCCSLPRSVFTFRGLGVTSLADTAGSRRQPLSHSQGSTCSKICLEVRQLQRSGGTVEEALEYLWLSLEQPNSEPHPFDFGTTASVLFAIIRWTTHNETLATYCRAGRELVLPGMYRFTSECSWPKTCFLRCTSIMDI